MPPPPHRARERRARFLLNPSGASAVELSPNRVRLVVFRDDKGQKLPLFDSDTQTLCSEGDGETSKVGGCGQEGDQQSGRGWAGGATGETSKVGGRGQEGNQQSERAEIQRRPARGLCNLLVFLTPAKMNSVG